MEVKKEIIKKIATGDIFQNLGKGTSTIIKINNEKIVYLRGKSNIELKYCDIQSAYDNFKGINCSSISLKQFNPNVFDSTRSGHSCNCTFFLMLLFKMGFIEGNIMGLGVRGNPFNAKII